MAQYLLNRIGSCKLFPQAHNAFSSALRIQTRTNTVWRRRDFRPVPEAEGGMTTETFLTSIGRSAVDKVKVTDWSKFWKLDGRALKTAGVPVRDRRYILWCMEKFRQGVELRQFAHPPTPKKKIRGHGPAVQNGKRIRSRRKH